MINFSKIAATSAASGFKNYNLDPVTFSGTIPAQTLTVGQVVSVSVSVPLDNTNAVSLIKLQYASINSYWYQMFGLTASTTIPFVSEYQLESSASYSGGNLVVTTYAINQTGGSISLPVQVINVRARLYKSPFSR
jgi:hypothetical protein